MPRARQRPAPPTLDLSGTGVAASAASLEAVLTGRLRSLALRGLGLGAHDGGKAVPLLCDALHRITSLRHLSLIGNQLSVEHVTSLIAAAGLRELLHVDLRHNPACPSAVPNLPTGWRLDLGPAAWQHGAVKAAEASAKIGGDPGSINLLQLFPDESRLIVAGSAASTRNATVYRPDASTVGVLEGHEADVVAVATDGVHIVTGDKSGSRRLWDADTLATAGQLQHSGSSVYCVAVSGDLVVSGSTDSTVKLWRLRARECVATLMEHSARVSCVDVGEEAIATGSDDATVRLWPRDGGASRRTLAHPRALRAVRMQGDVLATGGVDAVVRVFALSTGLLVRELRGHKGSVQSLALGGSVLVSGGGGSNETDETGGGSNETDTTIKVWSLLEDVDASECATLDTHPSHVRSVAISPSGGFIASVTNGEGAKLFVWRPADTKKER